MLAEANAKPLKFICDLCCLLECVIVVLHGHHIQCAPAV